MSPILVRPVREQLEHDRVIRQLQKDLSRRKMEVSINPGAEQNVAVGTGARREFPDAVLFSTDKARKILGIIEVETSESINHLEAMAQWAHYARLKAPFHLYVPLGSAAVARRLTIEKQILVAELHTHHQIGDSVRFAWAYRSGTAPKLPDDSLPGSAAEGRCRPPRRPLRQKGRASSEAKQNCPAVVARVEKNSNENPRRPLREARYYPVKPVAPVKSVAAREDRRPMKTVT